MAAKIMAETLKHTCVALWWTSAWIQMNKYKS